MDNNNKPVQIFSGTQWEVTMIKSLLENEKIESFIKNEIMGTLNPFYSSPGGTLQVHLMVSSNDFDNSIKVVEEYKKNAEK